MITKSLILARGGSKGIHKKNIVDLNGLPLISYVISASLGSSVDETWVSTDDEDIADVSSHLGAKVLMRPPELANDRAPSEPSLLHFAEHIDFDALVFIQPTSPLLRAKDINSGLAMMEDHDSVFSAYRQHWIPYWRLDGIPDGWDPLNRPRRQDVEERFVENGAFYITTKDMLTTSGTRCSGRIGIVEMPFHRSFQIDTPEDLVLASQMLHAPPS